MRRLLSLAALILLSAALSAQEYEQTIRKWSDGPLTWNDFSEFSGESSLMSDLYYGWRGERKKYKKGNFRMSYTETYTYMNTEQSWVNPYGKSPSLLQYEQMVFDYAEICRRQYMQEMRNDTDNKYSSKELSEYYFNKIARYEAEVGPQCDYGRDSTMLNYYSEQVAEQLSTLPDYSEPFLPKKNWAVGCDMGYAYEWFPGMTDPFFSNGEFFRMGFDVFYKKFRFGFDIMAKPDVVNSTSFYNGEVLWAEGLTRRYNHWEFNFGYTVYENDWFRLNPFAGVGTSRHFIVLGEDADGKEIRDNMNGLRFQAGICGDFKFYRDYSIYEEYSELALRFLAYGARTDIPGYGPLWSVNAGVSLYLFGWLFR